MTFICQQNSPNSPLVSILIPIHGHEPYLEETLRSIANENFNKFEIVVVIEDVSRKTKKIVHTSQLELKIVNYKGANGISGALNQGLNYCKGKYVARMDADDKFINNRLSKQVDYLEKNSHVDVLGSGYKTIGEDGKYLARVTPPQSHMTISWGLLLGNCIAHPTVMIRRKALPSANQIYRPKYNLAEDYDLWTRLIHKVTFYNLTEPLIEYRIESGTKMDRKQENLSTQISQREIQKISPQQFSEKEISDMVDLRKRRIPVSDKECAISNTHQLYSDFVTWAGGETEELRRYFVHELIKDIIASSNQIKDVYYLIDLLRTEPQVLPELLRKAWNTSLLYKNRGSYRTQ